MQRNIDRRNGIVPFSEGRKFPHISEIVLAAFASSEKRTLTAEQIEAQKELRGNDGLNFGKGYMVPFYEARAGSAMSATGTTSTTGDQGGMSIGREIVEIGTALRAGLVLESLGARVIGGLTGTAGLPRAQPTLAGAWYSENASPSMASELFLNLDLSPKRLVAWFDVSLQLIAQQSNIEQFLRTELMQTLGAEIQRVAIGGTGSGNQPLGILNTTGIGAVVGGTNGIAPTNAHLAALEYNVTGTSKADRGKCAWIVSPYVRQKLRQTFINGTGSDPVWDKDEAYSLFGHPAAVTPSSPDTLTKGTSAGVCSSIAFLEMSELFIGLWGQGIGIEAVYDTAMQSAGTIRVLATAYVDCGLRTPTAAAAMLDALCA